MNKSISDNLTRFLESNDLYDVYKALKDDESTKDFFDFSITDPSKISYLSGNRIPDDNALIWNDNYRKSKGYHTKIGKLISNKVDNKIIQKISALMAQRKSDSENIKIEKTADISHYYLEDNYENSKGTLGNSCMRYSELQEAIQFYDSISPKYVELLIIKNKNNELMARALLWHNVECNGQKIDYIDRVYANNDNLELYFRQYAEKNNILTRENNTNELSININIDNDTCMPYMDTFQYYNFEGYLNNRHGDVTLDSVDGNPIENTIQCYECGSHYTRDDLYYSNYIGDYICCNCGVYIEHSDDVFPISQCIQINDEWYHKNDDDIVYCENINDYDVKENTVYSEYENNWLSMNGDYIFSEYHEDYFSENNSEIVHSDFHDDYILKDDVVYSTIHDDYLLPKDDNIAFSKWHNTYVIVDDENIVYIESENDYYRVDSPVIFWDDVEQEYRHRQYSFILV